MSGRTEVQSDPNTMLVQLCVKALASVAPEGMTTKELAAALDKDKSTPGFNGISSSILSSKLNAIFRRCHGDSATPTRAQLAELPMTRSQSVEVPRRLVYRYTPADSAEIAEAPSTPVEDASSGDESIELDEPLTPKEDNLTDRSVFGHQAKKRRVSGNTFKESERYPTEPGTPPEIVTSTEDSKPSVASESSGSAQGQQVKADKQTQRELHSQTTAVLPRAKRPVFQDRPLGLNLYYDALGLDAMSAALKLKHPKAAETDATNSKLSDDDDDASADLDWSDFSSPELLGLHELDGFVC